MTFVFKFYSSNLFFKFHSSLKSLTSPKTFDLSLTFLVSAGGLAQFRSSCHDIFMDRANSLPNSLSDYKRLFSATCFFIVKIFDFIPYR